MRRKRWRAWPAVVLSVTLSGGPARAAPAYVDTQHSNVGVIHPQTWPPIPAAAVTPRTLGANRLGILNFCFVLRAIGEDWEEVAAIIRRRIGDGPSLPDLQKAGRKAFVLQPDGSFKTFFAVMNQYNTNAARACGDLLDSERKGGPDADRLPMPNAE